MDASSVSAANKFCLSASALFRKTMVCTKLPLYDSDRVWAERIFNGEVTSKTGCEATRSP